MPDIIVPTGLPDQLPVLAQSVLDEAERLCEQAHRLVVDATTFAEANEVYGAIHALQRRLDGERATLKKPVLALGRAIDEAARMALAPLDATKRTLGERIAIVQAAETERRRLALESERAAAQAAADHAAQAAAFEVLPDASPAEVAQAAAQAPTVRLPTAPAPVQSAVRVMHRIDIVSIDRAQLPATYMTPDLDAIRIDVQAGVRIPGVTTAVRTYAAAKGSR